VSGVSGVRVGPGDIGQRVVLRYLLPDGRATDVLGRLAAWDDSAATVTTRTGPVTVPLGDLLMGKTVPPPPAPRAPRRPLSVVDLHDLMADGWQPLERASYGGWRLRASAGFTGRANSVLPLGPPPDPLELAVDHVEGWYAERSLPGRFCVPWPLTAGPGEPAYGSDPLEQELVRRGYELDTPTVVMTARSSPTAALLPEHGLRVDVRETPDEAWLELYHYRGQELPDVAVPVLVKADTPAVQVAFSSLRDGDRAVAVGRVAVSRGWAGITAVEVALDHRRQGLGRQMLGALLAWAQDAGAHSSYLQVARANTGAIALYAGSGYRPHSGYHYRIQTS
jgi:N-acetylglutamate synthase